VFATFLRRLATALILLVVLLALPLPAAAQDVAPEPGVVHKLLSTIGRDLKSIASKESVPLLSSAAAFALFVSPFDETLTYSASCSTFLKTTFEPWARTMGQEWLLASGALATYLTGRATASPRVAAIGGDLMEAQLLAGAVTLGLKYAVNRERPDREPRSFPSGHAAGTFAAASVLQRHFGWRGAVPAYTAAVLISGARLQANSHFSTDVIAGAALGILAGRAATFDMAGARVSASPAIVPGGGAVSFSIRSNQD
jgi:membrane-associated phospholipid phosphatase